MEFDLEDPFSGLCILRDEEEGEATAAAAPRGAECVEKGVIDGSISDLFSAESDHTAYKNLTFDICLRQQSASLIHQAHASCNSVDPFVVYLAVNYLDRFLSRQEMPREKPWIVRLLSVACLSLASKMRKTRFCIEDVQGGKERFIFDARTIRRMELLVLGALGWRMRSITPFSFLKFFLSFMRPNRRPLLSSLKSRATQIIFKAQSEMKLLEYKPSVVAAAALLCAANELSPIQFPAFRGSILCCSWVDKEELSQCHAVMWHTSTGTGGRGCQCHPSLSSSSCGTPVSVLGQHHRHCSSSESENNAAGSEVIGKVTEKED